MKLLLKNLLKANLIGFIVISSNISHATEKVDVLFLYSPEVSQHYGGSASTRINHIIESTNAIYASSNLDIEINAAEIQQYDIDDTINPYTLMKNAKSSSKIQALRNKFGADLVVLYGLYQSGKPCGLGYRPTTLNSKWIGISYVAINCAVYKTAHEIGHNMGLGHSYAQGSIPFLKYARGHGVEGKFATIMAYSSAYHAPKIYKFSSPTYKCKDITCGVKEGSNQEADAVRALRQTAPIVANLRKPQAEEQCNTQQQGTYSAIKTSYQKQKNKTASLLQQLTTLKLTEKSSKDKYQQILTSYKKIITDSFYPTQKEYQTARSLFVKQLPDYRKGKISREKIIETYLKYRKARKQLITLYSEIRQFHSTQYLPAYKQFQADKNKLTTLQKAYNTEKIVLTQLQSELDKANAIYTCA